MPIKQSRAARLAALAAVAASAGAATPSTAAAAGCAHGPTSPAFAQFGDTAEYFLAPGGDFEGAFTWSSRGPWTIVDENEPFMLAGPGDTRSLRLLEDASARTPRICVTREHPHLRFVARSGGSGQLDVTVRRFGEDGKVTDSSSGSVSPSDHAAWAPSRNVDLKVDKLEPGETGLVDVRFRSQGDWHIDDVFIDPYARG